MKKENKSCLSAPRLREERVRLGLLQEDAGSRWGISRVTWGKYERGESTPDSEVLAGLAELGADTQYILEGTYRFEDIGNRLREERIRLGKNINDMALTGGVTPDVQSEYEMGIKRPTASYMNAIGAAGAEVFYILLGEKPDRDVLLDADEQSLVHNYRSCSSEIRQAITVMAENGAKKIGS